MLCHLTCIVMQDDLRACFRPEVSGAVPSDTKSSTHAGTSQVEQTEVSLYTSYKCNLLIQT